MSTFTQADLANLSGNRSSRGVGSTGVRDNKIRALLRDRQVDPSFYTYFERFEKRPQLNAGLGGPTTLTITDPTDAPGTADILREDLVDNTLPEIEAYGNTTVTDYLTQAFLLNKDVELAGTNADNAGVTFLEGGGIRLETVGADADQHILQAHQDTNQSALEQINWDSRNQPLFFANIVTGPQAADLHNCRIFVGFKLTATDVVATDADQFYFSYDANALTTIQTWDVVTSVGGSDAIADTGETLIAATNYELLVVLDDGRKPHFYINGIPVAVGSRQPAVTALATYEFFIGIASRGQAEAKQLDVRNFMVSQLYG